MSEDYEDHMVQEVDENEEEAEEPQPEETEEVETEEVEEVQEDTQEVEEESEETEETGEDEEEYDKPVSEGEVVELDIEDLGSKGDGIARVEGFVVFVPGGEVDETYDVEITSVGRKFAFGEIAE